MQMPLQLHCLHDIPRCLLHICLSKWSDDSSLTEWYLLRKPNFRHGLLVTR